MTSELDKRIGRLLSFSRRMEDLVLKETDFPKFSPESVKDLLDAISSSLARASEEGTEDFWRKFAEKCDAAGLDGNHYSSRHDYDMSVPQILGQIMHTKRMQTIDALELMFRTPGMPADLAQKIKEVLESNEYCIDNSGKPTCIQWSPLLGNS